MGLQFFNTLSRRIEPFVPLDPQGQRVKLYTCGPTVYNHAHIGNFRAYIFEDVLQRHLEARGFLVDRVMNLTDVDDKTIRGCRQAGVSLAQFTQPFKEAFFADKKTLRILPARAYPEATAAEHIGRMIEMIGLLIERGHAYQAEDGSVYFRIRSFPRYGALAHINLEELQPSGRVRADEYEKESVGDFALWKAWDEADGDVGWESPWGRGRPGWHIECSAMATGLLGPQLDIHCGGEDNIFPHHEAEIAQSECVTGLTFARYWLHCRHLMVEGRKMAKSEGNFFTLRDLLAEGWSGREVRYLLLSVRYREPLNFTREGLAGARSALKRLDEWTRKLREIVRNHPTPADGASLPDSCDLQAFGRYLDDDLNISGALGSLFEVVRETNRLLAEEKLLPAAAARLLQYREEVEKVLAVAEEESELPSEVEKLLAARAAARSAKNWAESDRLRDAILALGFVVKDTKAGQQISPQRGI